MDYSLETLKREYIDIVRNNFVIMTTNDSFNEQAANRLIDIFKKMNISSFYKFKSLGSKYTIPNLKDDIFHFSLISQLNDPCNGVQREHNKKLNNGLPILHKVPPKRDYGRYFCIMAEKGGTSHGGLTEKLSLFFHAKKQEVNAYGR